jgi:phasin family protein
MPTSKSVKSVAAPAVEAAAESEEVVAVQLETGAVVAESAEAETPAESAEVEVAEVAAAPVKSVPAKSVEKAVAKVAAQPAADVFAGYDEILKFNKDNFDAWVKSGTVVARGVQDLSKSFVVLAQETLEESVAATRALAGARTFQEAVDLSSSLAKSSLDKIVAEGSKITQLSSKLAEEAIAPISVRVDAAVHRFTRTAA